MTDRDVARIWIPGVFDPVLLQPGMKLLLRVIPGRGDRPTMVVLDSTTHGQRLWSSAFMDEVQFEITGLAP